MQNTSAPPHIKSAYSVGHIYAVEFSSPRVTPRFIDGRLYPLESWRPLETWSPAKPTDLTAEQWNDYLNAYQVFYNLVLEWSGLVGAPSAAAELAAKHERERSIDLIKDIRANTKRVRQLKAQHIKQHGCTFEELRLKRLKGQLDSAGTPFDPVVHRDGAIDRDGKWIRR
jgi:hypothetical protein